MTRMARIGTGLTRAIRFIRVICGAAPRLAAWLALGSLLALAPPRAAGQAPSAGSPPAASAARPRGDTSVDLGGGALVELVYVRAGSFAMGSTTGAANEKPVHRVAISKGFLMGRFEVTQREWKAVMGSNPSGYVGDDLPVEQVSWADCQEFLRRLNEKTGGGWRLPTEAEWEYACRAGTTGDFAGDLEPMAWYGNNSGRERIDVGEIYRTDASNFYSRLAANGCQTHPVGLKRPNAWGLYDMHGNVWEWCQDWFGESYYAASPRTDPPGPASGVGRVYRGGSWAGAAFYCRSATRFAGGPSDRYGLLGLRLARNSE